MPVDCTLRLRLEAHVQGRALPTHSHACRHVRPSALVIASLQFPGEDGLLQAIALGRPGDSVPRVLRVIPNPRDRALADALYDEVGCVFEREQGAAAGRGDFPQIVVGSRAALDHLTNLADDLRFWDQRPAAAFCGSRLSYFTTRAEVAGQQAVVILTDELTHHWVTPLSPLEERHLGVLVAAITTPPAGDLVARIRAAERVPMGPRTDPEFDREHLAPPLRRYANAVRRAAAAAEIATHADAVSAVLRPVLVRSWRAIQAALQLLEAAQYPPLPVVADLEAEERQAFARFRALIAVGRRLPRQDRARGGTLALTGREEATATLGQAIACHDRLGQILALEANHHLAGSVVRIRQQRVPGRTRRATLIEIASMQRATRLRVDDELITAHGPVVAGVVRQVRPEGTGVRVILLLSQGVRDPSRYALGRALVFARRRPDPTRIGRAVRAVAAKLTQAHWTRGDAPLPEVRLHGSGGDPLRVLEVLQ